MKAITTKEIRGRCIPTIPVGTTFDVIAKHADYSVSRLLPITLIWNDEYAFVPEPLPEPNFLGLDI